MELQASVVRKDPLRSIQTSVGESQCSLLAFKVRASTAKYTLFLKQHLECFCIMVERKHWTVKHQVTSYELFYPLNHKVSEAKRPRMGGWEWCRIRHRQGQRTSQLHEQVVQASMSSTTVASAPSPLFTSMAPWQGVPYKWLMMKEGGKLGPWMGCFCIWV